jgi:hypothetical protein
MCKYRGDQVKKIKAALIDCFPNRIPKFNSRTDFSIVNKFKKSDDAKWCLRHLNSRIDLTQAQPNILIVLQHHL